MISGESRPRLATKARLRFDRQAARYLLLYPERGLELNPTASDVLQRCTGEYSVSDIAAELAQRYGHEATAIEREVLAFLCALAERGLVEVPA
jgi:coenzyme PQQ biosynthesis protein PqqD